MNLLLSIVPHHLPTFICEEILDELFAATADAFGCPAPAHDHLPYDERLRAYALFTSQQAAKALQDGQDIAALKARLYQNAYPLGAKLHKWLGVDTLAEVMGMGQILY